MWQEIASLGFISTYPRGEEQSEKTVDYGLCTRADGFAELCPGERFFGPERNKWKHCVIGTDKYRRPGQLDQNHKEASQAPQEGQHNR